MLPLIIFDIFDIFSFIPMPIFFHYFDILTPLLLRDTR